VCHDVLQDPTFFRFLSKIDREFAAATRAERCAGCGGPLHVSDYPRKPRGCPAAVREEYSQRLSFTCARAAADVGSSVHDEIDNGGIPAMTCSDSQSSAPTFTFAAWFAVEPRASAGDLSCPTTFAMSHPQS
jgi:hypothetical protein